MNYIYIYRDRKITGGGVLPYICYGYGYVPQGRVFFELDVLNRVCIFQTGSTILKKDFMFHILQ